MPLKWCLDYCQGCWDGRADLQRLQPAVDVRKELQPQQVAVAADHALPVRRRHLLEPGYELVVGLQLLVHLDGSRISRLQCLCDSEVKHAAAPVGCN